MAPLRIGTAALGLVVANGGCTRENPAYGVWGDVTGAASETLDVDGTRTAGPNTSGSDSMHGSATMAEGTTTRTDPTEGTSAASDTQTDEGSHYVFYVSDLGLEGDWRATHEDAADDECRKTQLALGLACESVVAMVEWGDAAVAPWTNWISRTGVVTRGRAVLDLAGTTLASDVAEFLEVGPSSHWDDYDINSDEGSTVVIWTGMSYRQGVDAELASCSHWEAADLNQWGVVTWLDAIGPGWWGTYSQPCYDPARFMCLCDSPD